MMHMMKRSVLSLSVAMALAGMSEVHATNGYFVHGYGTKSSGMGGVGIALPQDAIAAATNPAGMSWTGSGATVGAMLFNPRRDASLDATNMGGMPYEKDSGATMFMVPNAGFVMDMAGGMTMGFSMYANGGMNTRYNDNIYFNAFASGINAFVGSLMSDPTYSDPDDQAAIGAAAAMLAGNPTASSTLGVNLAQLIMAPTVSYKLNDQHAVGASLLVGYQRFRAYGFGLFEGLSQSMGSVTNNGDDDAWGAGVRLGWTGKLTDSLTLGATYASKIYMQEFEKYKGLFAEDGDFDIPANYGVGISFRPNDQLTLAFDVQRIEYGDVKAIANDGPTPGEFFQDIQAALTQGTTAPSPFTGRAMGGSNGYGFGWESQTVYKLGVAYAMNEQLTLRAGFNYGESPIPDDQNLLNITAPGVVEKHATLGMSFAPDQSSEISFAYMHAFRKDQKMDYGPYAADIGMSQNAAEISYSLKF